MLTAVSAALVAVSLSVAAADAQRPAISHTAKQVPASTNSIIWPKPYLPGTTDNYVSNEVIVRDLSVAEVWPYLVDTRAWPTYYDNATDIRFHDDSGPKLSAKARFRFTTFGFPVEGEIVEFVPPAPGKPARIAWHGWAEGDADHRLDVHHAWLLEDLPGHRVRILTQESQFGKPARELSGAHPNPMLNKHQEWLDGLAKAAKAKTSIN